MPPKKNDTNKLDALLASVTEVMLGDDLPQQFTDNGIRVERLLLEMVRPDPVQARRVLPERIHFKFHEDRLTPTQALRELVQLAQVSARQQGRPFANMLELLPNSDNETEEPEKLSPEEDTLRDLVNLAVTIRDDGQVNPVTVVDVSQGVTRLYRIETGERRYWAAWLLRDFFPEYESNGMIDCIVVPAENSSVFRQAKENTARKGLTAIAMARQAALLLLTVHSYEIPLHAVNNDFYRQALDLDLRGKREYTESVLSAMGGIGRRHFSRYKSLLRLSDDALVLADQHDIDEGRLRHVIKLNQEDQVEMLRQIIQFRLSRKQVQDLIEKGETEDQETSELIPKSIVQIAKLMRDKELPDPQHLAKYLFEQEDNAHMVRARLHTLRQLLDETEKYLTD
ncbi:MAG: ParB N-terminal domain-containing protein [Phototrophicaceae bacterium]